MKNPLRSKVIKRLKIVEGQVRALQRMINQDKYCIDVLTQSAAVKQALSGVEDAILENHLGSCVAQQMRSGKTTQATKEILTVYRLSKKK